MTATPHVLAEKVKNPLRDDVALQVAGMQHGLNNSWHMSDNVPIGKAFEGELHLLGGATILVAGGDAPAGAMQPRRLALLAILAEAYPHPVSRDRLVGLLWPEQTSTGARRLLTQALYVLRRELGDGVIRASAIDLVFHPPMLRSDLIEFRDALRAGDVASAAALYRGPFLDGLYIKGAPEFERWSDNARHQLLADFRALLDAQAEAAETAGDLVTARRWRERLVSLMPFDSATMLRYVDLLSKAGDPGSALSAVTAYARRMQTELDLPADPAILERASRLQAAGEARSPAAATPAPAPAPAPALAGSGQPAPASVPAQREAPRIETPSRWRRLVGAAVVAATAWMVVRSASAPAATTGRIPPATPAPATPIRHVRIAPWLVHGDSAGVSALLDLVGDALVTGASGANGVVVERAASGDVTSRDRAAPGQVALGATMDLSGNQLRIELDRPGAQSRLIVTGTRDSVLAMADQLTRELVTALYAELGETTRESALRGTHSTRALRSYLDGEMALRRGDFGSAWNAFREATLLDTHFSAAWYRRAIAAEYTQRTQDADSAVVEALANARQLTTRDRDLYVGYASWREGDGQRSEANFRELVSRNRFDRDAWFQLAEVLFHGAGLLGYSMDDATDAWRTVIALDSSNFEAIVHGFRTEARARNAVALRSLRHRLELLGATGAVAGESRVLAAHGIGTDEELAAIGPLVDSLPDYSLFYVHSMLAGMLGDPLRATPYAQRLTAPTRPRTVRAQGHIALAHLAVARGRFSEAWRELDLAAPLDPVPAAWARAYFATLPFAESRAADRIAARRSLDGLRGITGGGLPLSLELAVDVPASTLITAYHRALLMVAEGEAPVPLSCDERSIPRVRSLCPDLQFGVNVAAGLRRKSFASDEAMIDRFVPRVPYQFAGRSTYFSRTRERWLRAEALMRAGQDAAAEKAFASIALGARLDYIYLAPSLVRRGQLLEKLGKQAEAAARYREAAALLRDAEPEMYALRDIARAGAQRTVK